MAGSEHAGIDAAREDLFQGAVWALTPADSASLDSPAYLTVKRLADGIGAVTRTLGAREHDEAVALTSHLPHILAYTLMAMAAEESSDNPELAFLSAGSFASATRVAGSLPSLWQGIAIENQKALSESLAGYRSRLDEVQKALDSGDADSILEIFQAGHDARLKWPGR
jgi:prephenate dehydrogenase